MIVHVLSVKGRTATCDNLNLVQGSRGVDRIVLDLDAEWQNVAIELSFVYDGGAVRAVPKNEDETYTVPWECMANAGSVRAVVEGRGRSGEVMKHARMETAFYVQPSDFADDAPAPGEPTAGEWREIAEQAKQATKTANDAAADIARRAEAGEFDGPQGPAGPQGPEGKPGDWGVRDGEVYLEPSALGKTAYIKPDGTIAKSDGMKDSLVYAPVRIPRGIESVRIDDGGCANRYIAIAGWSESPDIAVGRRLSSPVATGGGPRDVAVPKGVRWLVVAANVTSSGVLGEAPRVFAGPNRALDALDAADELRARVDGLNGGAGVRISLPNEFRLVVGDRFELFWKGCVQAQDPYRYAYRVTCGIGSAYRRFFAVTPKTAGTHQLKVELLDDSLNVVGTASTTLRVVEKPAAPTARKNVLCVGDSLLVGGRWAAEAHRRLTQSGGSPVGLGIGNVAFVGGMKSGTCGYEGNGGWTFDSYNTENRRAEFVWVTCAGHGKTGADQHSVYRDANGAEWKIETLEESRLKMIRVKGSTAMPASDSLAWVSGGENHGAIAYTASETAPGNPFWDSETGRVDFAKYARRVGAEQLDYVYVLMGWNSTGQDADAYGRDVKTFIGNVHAAFPSCRVALLGMQAPSQDGMAENYGCAWPYLPKLAHAFDRNALYEKIADETPNCAFVNISAQFDTENNMQASDQPVNCRSTKKEARQVNGVHPAQQGYDQIADAVFRDLCAALSEGGRDA